MALAIERKLADAGYRMFIAPSDKNQLTLDILKTRDTRYLKAIPFLISKYDLDLNKIYEETREHDILSEIIEHTREIFLAYGIDKKLPLFPKGEKDLGISYKELMDEFSLHYEAEQTLLIEKQRIEKERFMRISLSKLFTPLERKIMERVLEGKPISKTDYEYYSRKTKKKLKSIMNLQDFARTQLAIRPKQDEDLFHLKKSLEKWIEINTPHKEPEIIRFFSSNERISITFTKKHHLPNSPHQWFNTVQLIRDFENEEIRFLVKKYDKVDFR